MNQFGAQVKFSRYTCFVTTCTYRTTCFLINIHVSCSFVMNVMAKHASGSSWLIRHTLTTRRCCRDAKVGNKPSRSCTQSSPSNSCSKLNLRHLVPQVIAIILNRIDGHYQHKIADFSVKIIIFNLIVLGYQHII